MLRLRVPLSATIAAKTACRAMASISGNKFLRQQAFVNGEWVQAADGRVMDVLNPATGEKIAQVPVMQRSDVARACEVSHAAWDEWKRTTAKSRSTILRKMANLMMENQQQLAELITAECGKPTNEAMGEVAYAASFYEFFAEEAKRAYGDVIPSPMPGRRILAVKQPVGPSALITPWNFPSAMITRKVGPALAAGCTVVIKPAEDTPLSALALCQIAEEAGVPAGVINVVTSDRANVEQVGHELANNNYIRKLSFTGSTAVGKWLMRECASTIKKVSLELGGNAPFIIFEDADLDNAVKQVIASKFRNAGQTCVCTNRILVHESVHDEFARRLAEAVRKFRVGDGAEKGTDIGPLINNKGLEKVERHVNDARSKGGDVLVGGNRHSLGGNFFEPTVIGNATTDMACWSEESFGPIAPIFKFRTEDEAIRMANDTQFGLAGYACTKDLGRAWRVAEGLEYGMVGINEGVISTEVAPFGGVKQSGLGREGSKYGLDEYMEVKYVCMGGI